MQYNLRTFIDSGDSLDLSSFTWSAQHEIYVIAIEVSEDTTLMGWIELKERSWKTVLIKPPDSKRGREVTLFNEDTAYRNEGIALLDTFIKAEANKLLAKKRRFKFLWF